MIPVVDYENKDLGRIKNYDEKFLNTIKENNVIKLMIEEQFIEYGKKLRKEYREQNKGIK